MLVYCIGVFFLAYFTRYNRLQLQISSLETRIEKMQEMFNKDLEEIKKSQSIMNNAINEIKNTLEGLKEMRTTLETSGTMLNTPTFES